MKTPITYYGGKQTLVKYLLALIPQHKIYCEPFLILSSLVSELEYMDDPARTKPQKKRMKQGEWYATQLFREGATAPQSGFQDRARLGNMLTEWSEKGKIDFAPFVKTSGRA